MKSNECPIRVEFRFKGGTRHYQYFPTVTEALVADDCMIVLDRPWSVEFTRRNPTSKQIQKKGPRGGWSKQESM